MVQPAWFRKHWSLASKPVMEGKGVLFKKFAGVDVFDIEIAENRSRQDRGYRCRIGTNVWWYQPGRHQGT